MSNGFKKLGPGEHQKIPVVTHKRWAFTSASVGIDIEAYSGSLSDTSSYAYFTESNHNTATRDSVYRQVRHLYYGGNPTGGVGRAFYTGSGEFVDSHFYTFGDNHKNMVRKLDMNDGLTYISIPQLVYGDEIKRKSVSIKNDNLGISLKDDGYGNLYDTNTSSNVGNVFYEHGNIIISTGSQYEGVVTPNENFSIVFDGTHTIYEHSVYCSVDEHEFNFSMNDSLRLTGSDGNLSEWLIDMATGSSFQPYVTTIGLYNDNGQMVAVGKLTRAFRKDPNLSTTFLVKIDM